MKFKFLKLTQENINMYLIKMTADELIENYEVLRYNSQTNENYQRPPIPAHYRKIAAYFLAETNPILPTAIIAAVSPDHIKEEDNEIDIDSKIRIVDGQHRIEGLKALKNEYGKSGETRFNEIKEKFDFPVILMVIDTSNEMVEIDAFININSKGKRVRTDLAESLKSRKRAIQNKTAEVLPVNEALISDISLAVCRKLNTDKDSFWKGLIIQADENGNRNDQPITVVTLSQALHPLIADELRDKNEIQKEEFEIIVGHISELFLNIWDLVIEKWPECFNRDKGTYDKAYNICKGLGVIPLVNIYCELNNSIEDENALDAFQEKLRESTVKASDWLVGGSFTGLSSGQGKTMIKQYICGEITNIFR